MDFNTLLLRLGLDPGNFANKLNEPIKTDNGFIYEVDQVIKKQPCPYCKSQSIYIKGYFTSVINCTETNLITDILRIRKVRFKCRNCNKCDC